MTKETTYIRSDGYGEMDSNGGTITTEVGNSNTAQT